MEKIEKLIEVAGTLVTEATPVGTLNPKQIESYEISSGTLGSLIQSLGDVNTNNKKLSKYEELALTIGKLVTEKQIAYGNSFGMAGAVLRILYPNGITLDQYDDVLTVTRIIDKLFRVANLKDYNGENPYTDIAGYGLLGALAKQDEMAEPEKRGERYSYLSCY